MTTEQDLIREAIREVLVEHRINITEGNCRCGYVGVQAGWLVEHQVDMMAPAIREIQATAIEDCAWYMTQVVFASSEDTQTMRKYAQYRRDGEVIVK